MALVLIARNAVVAKLVNPPREIVAFVNNLLSYEADAQIGWSGKSSFLDVLTNSFPAGFTHLVREELSKAGHTVQLVQKPLPRPLGPENPIVDEFGNDNPDYDYQMRALRQVEKHGAGIVRVATGGGKSKIAKLIMARLQRMTLFLTTRGVLLYQMKDQLDEEVGVIGDGSMSFVKSINLGMVQTLVQALEEPNLQNEILAIVKSINLSKSKADKANMTHDEIKAQATKVFERKKRRREVILKFLSLVEVVIGEEAHEAGGKSYFEILRHCKNATYRIALTATPFMRSSAEDNMRLMAAFGPVLIDVSEELLIKRGILAKPYFRFVDCPAPKKLLRTMSFARGYELGYIDNEDMHAQIVRDALRAKSYNLPVLTLVARKKHGDALLKAFKAAGLKFVFLRGENDMEERRKMLKKLVSGEIHGVIGTTILDVGVDVPAIGLVQLAGGMKAQVALRQRIGRGLRRKKFGPNIAFIADYSCNTNITLKDHARQREGIVRATPGFVEGIIDEGDFPWWKFEQKAA